MPRLAARSVSWSLGWSAIWVVVWTTAALAQRVTAFDAAKAQSLLATQLPCLGCHELNGSGGRVGPPLTDVANRRNASYIRAIVEDPQRVVPGAAMPKTPMPPAMRDLIVRYLARDAAPGPAPSPSPDVTPVTRVSAGALYMKWCASCHGQTGGGDGANAQHLPVSPAIHRSAARMSVRSDDALFDAIAGGGAVMGKSPRMPAFGATLSHSEIRALVGYIRALCQCAGPAWSRDGAAR